MPNIVLLFALVGPLVGSIALNTAAFLIRSDVVDFGAVVNSLLFGTFFGVWGLVLAVPLGIVPAAIAGVLYARIVRRFAADRNFSLLGRVLIGGALGFVLSVTFYVALIALKSRDGDFSLWFAFAGGPGIAAGGLCAALVFGRRHREALQPFGLEFIAEAKSRRDPDA